MLNQSLVAQILAIVIPPCLGTIPRIYQLEGRAEDRAVNQLSKNVVR
jgi:hypothetical protein